MSMAFGSSEGVGAAAAFVSAATDVAFFLAADDLLCAFGITRNTLEAINSVHEKYFFRLFMRI